MGNVKKWKKEDWAEIQGETVTDKGRPYSKIAIGEKETNGESYYISEEMYTDIFDYIQQKRPEYKVYVNYNETPRIVVYFNNCMINSNNSFKQMRTDVYNILKKLFIPDVLKAYFDFVKGENSTPAIEILRNRIKEETKEMYQIMFLKPIVEDYVTNNILKVNDNQLSNLSTYEFTEVIASMIYKKVNSPIYNKLLEEFGEKEAKELIFNEMTRRYMKGEK